jgi:hypothetical protein
VQRPANESQGKVLDRRLRVRAERFRVLFKQRRIRDRKTSRSIRRRRSRLTTLQMMGGENPIEMSGSDLCISKNEIARPPYFQNRVIMFCLPISTFIYLGIYKIYKSLTDT